MRPSQQNDHVQRRRPGGGIAPAAALAMLMALSLTAGARGQLNPVRSLPQPQPLELPAASLGQAGDQETKFSAFPLRQIDAATAEQQLARFFASTPGVEIVADAPRNRVLVWGNQQVIKQVGELLAKLDAPAAAAPAAPPSQQLDAYPLTPAARTVLAALQEQAGDRPDIRIAMDERTSQALVLAPTSIHDQIREKLVQASPPSQVDRRESTAADRAQSHFASTPAPQPTTTNTKHQLRNLRADDLRVRLERLLARPLPASSDSTGQWQSFVLEAVSGAGVTVTVSPTTGELHLSGPADRTAAWRKVIEALDSAPTSEGNVTQLVTTMPANHERVRRVLEAVQGQYPEQPRTQGGLVAALMQERDAGAATQPGAAQPGATQVMPAPERTALDAATLAQAAGELLGPVDIQYVEGLDVIVIRGNERDVERVVQIINQIEQLSAVTVPTIEIYPLRYVESRAMGALMSQLYTQVLGPRLGTVNITPLGKPNALLLVGRTENVNMAKELIQKLDQPVAPTTRFQIFPLKYAAAAAAKTMIDEFLEQDEEEEDAEEAPSLAPKAIIVADVRTNSLIVTAGPRDLEEIQTLVTRIDAPSGAAVDQVRVFPLKNAVASELAEVLRAAIQGEYGPDGGDVVEAGAPGSRASAIEFRRLGGEPGQAVRSGVLTGARISADARANTLVVAAPAESMDLIAALIAQLDQAPDVAAELKVFTLENGDAQGLTDMLRTLFAVGEGAQATTAGGVGAGGLVRLQFSTDLRTNSIIAAGTRDDLAVVEAILLRLDAGDVRERINTVYRLNNAYALNVSDTLNAWLQTQRTAEQQAEVALSPFEQIEREVIIVPEIATNSLVVSATPRYYETIRKIIEELDERPPMVMIQVLIAEVRLNDTDEFGVELGLQDSLLFDRSLLSDIDTISSTTETQSPGGAVTTVTQDTVINSSLNPGFNFNSGSPLGNNGSTSALATASNVAAQGLSNFSLGRVNSDLNFGGFVFSASSNSVNILLRALQEKRRLEVLSRPQLMALDGQTGYVLVGQLVPTIASVSFNEFGQTNTTTQQNVGVQFQVTPRISPEGLVVMELYTEKSEVGPEAEGIPIFVTTDGQTIRSPRINLSRAITTVSAMDGQTVVLSGLLTNRREDVHRRVPLLSDIPLLGNLFRYDRVSEQRTELLIIMTPKIIHTKIDSDLINQVESSRMSWILSDVINLHGDVGMRSRCDEWYDGETEAVYPTYVPAADEITLPQETELLPAPPSQRRRTNGPSLAPPGATPSPGTSGSGQLRTHSIQPAASRSESSASSVTQMRYDEFAPTPSTQGDRYAMPPTRLPQ